MIRVGIYGYGNIGKGIECGIRQNSDMTLAAVFTRRDPSQVKTVFGEAPVYSADDVLSHKDEIDVMIMCGGSATDLPVQTPALAEHFNVIDSFDTHARIAEHFANVDKTAKAGGKTAIISVGWDPGLFSLNRLYAEAILPEGNNYTFWGKGISQGHSDAIRRIDGVLDARQYTVPVPAAVEAVRNGENPELTTRMKHTRECWVVAAEGADKARIEQEIKTMPNYFADYDTTVNFISQEELNEKHGVFLIRESFSVRVAQVQTKKTSTLSNIRSSLIQTLNSPQALFLHTQERHTSSTKQGIPAAKQFLILLLQCFLRRADSNLHSISDI